MLAPEIMSLNREHDLFYFLRELLFGGRQFISVTQYFFGHATF